MSNSAKVKRPKKPPAWIRARVRKDLACPDCTSVVRLGYRDDGELQATVDHEATCPKVPKGHRERGEFRYVVSPVAVTVPTNRAALN